MVPEGLGDLPNLILSIVITKSRDLEKERPDRDRMWFLQRKYPLILL